MGFTFIDSDKAPVADSQSQERKNYRVGAIQTFKQAAIQAKIREFPLDVQNIFNLSYDNMMLVHEAFNSTTAKMQVGWKGSEINDFANMMMHKLFNPGEDMQSRSVSTVFMMMIHEFIFEKQFFKGIRAGTIAKILQGATLGLFAKWSAAVYKSQNKADILKLLAKNAAGEAINKVASAKSLSQAMSAMNALRATASKQYAQLKGNASSPLKEMNICYACYALLLYTGAVNLYFCEQTYPTAKDNQPQLAGLKALLDLYQSLLFDSLFLGKDLREVQLHPNNLILNSQVNLQSIPAENETVKLAFSTLQYYNNPTELNQQNMRVCYEKSTKGSAGNILSYNDLVPARAILSSLTAQAGSSSGANAKSFLSQLSSNISNPESCLKVINEQISKITSGSESPQKAKDQSFVDLVFKAADSFKNGTLDPAAAINQSPTDLINSVKDAAQKASSGIFGKAANATTQQSPTALNQGVQYVNLEK